MEWVEEILVALGSRLAWATEPTLPSTAAEAVDLTPQVDGLVIHVASETSAGGHKFRRAKTSSPRRGED